MILLLEPIHGDARRLLEEVDEVVLATEPDPADWGVDRTAIRAVVTRGHAKVDPRMIDALPALRVVARCGAGLDNVDLDAAEEHGVAVVHAPGSSTAAVAEHAVMLMLALARRLPGLDAAVRSGKWDVRSSYEATEMRGRRLGIIGGGGIGTRIAEIGNCLGMDVVATTARADAVVPRIRLEELLMTSDVVQLCTSLRPETIGLLGSAELSLVRPEVLIINTARGALIDHAALVEALRTDRIGGYAADVWCDEPPTDLAPLDDRRVIVTPHVAALTDVTFREICVRTADSVVAVLSGDDPDPATVRLAPLAH